MINPLEAKKLITDLVAHIEEYVAAAEQHAGATVFSEPDFQDEDEVEELNAANARAEAVYPKLMESIQEAKRLVA